MIISRATRLLALLLLWSAPTSAADKIEVVAAENFYGDIAQQIGGPEVTVTSILNNPDQDPHLFEASPAVARAVAAARVVIYNGLDYDPWIDKLLHAVGGHDRMAIAVAALTGTKTGDNPHLWYDPTAIRALAAALTTALAEIDPSHHADYTHRLDEFRRSLIPIETKIAALRQRLLGMPVTATEPVFGYTLAALGMQVRNQRFQLAVMNNTEPAASDVATFEDDLRRHRVRLLVYNSQASDRIARRMVEIARASQIPVVGVTETEPNGEGYQAWMASLLDAIDRALPK